MPFLYAHCSRILVIPMQGKSHMIATNAIGQELKKNGHEERSDLCILLKKILQVRESVFLKKGLNIRSLVNSRSPLLSYCISFISSSFESNNRYHFSPRFPPKCTNHIYSQWTHTEFMNTFWHKPFADWIEWNDTDCLFRKTMESTKNLNCLATNYCNVYTALTLWIKSDMFPCVIFVETIIRGKVWFRKEKRESIGKCCFWSISTRHTLGENCALAANQSVDCRATTPFTIGLNSAKAGNRGFNWPVAA